jgi:ribonuclease-3
VAPSHAPQFLVEVRLGERSLAQGQGRTKKQAEQMAAREALETLLKPARDEES